MPRASKRALSRLNAAIAKMRAAADADEQAATDRDLKVLSDHLDTATRFRFDPSLGRELYAGSGPKKPTAVVIDVDEVRAREAVSYTWNATQKVQTRRDGSVRVTFTCDDFAPVIAWVLRFGSHAKVVKPAALAEMVAKQQEEAFHRIAEQYESPARPRGRSGRR
jgi:predicted DNA-binding transcriptional regulator YafY